jgi:polar amino acid transport system substrate-binding protein
MSCLLRSVQIFRPISLACLFFLFSLAHSQTLLRWGGDSEGGAPYSFQNPEQPTVTIGYEVDLMDHIARKMGRKALFVQNQWDGLIPGLQRGNYEVVANGLEITDDRKEEIAFSEPYYITYEQLLVRKNTYTINSLSDCVGKKVGALKYAVAERILRAQANIEVRSYEGDFNAFEDLANGRIDAVLMDLPLAIYYGKPNTQLKMVGNSISRIEYGFGIRKEDSALLQQINQILGEMKQDGSLRRILEPWGLWNNMMADYLGDHSPSTIQPERYNAFLKAMGLQRTWQDRVAQYLGYIPLLGRGAVTTLELSLISMFLAITIGLAVTLMRLYLPAPFSTMAIVYVELIRGTPLLIQLFLIFYGLPNLGIKLSPFVAAVVGLGINYSAYEAELYRAGILAIPPTQTEAALALALSKTQTIRHIIIPQALRVVIPPVTNDFIALLKDSSLVSVITMVELTKVYGQLATTYYDYFGIGLLTAAMYLFIGLPFVRISRWAEKYFSYYYKRPGQSGLGRKEDRSN